MVAPTRMVNAAAGVGAGEMGKEPHPPVSCWGQNVLVYEMGTVGGFEAQSGLASQPTLTTAPVDVLIALLLTALPARFTMED